MKNTLCKQRGSTLLGVFIGLVIGILIAFGVVWYMNKANLPFQDKAPPVERREAPGQASAPLPGKPGDKVGVGEKPRFEFYKMLPAGQEEGGAPAAPRPAPQEAAKPAAEAPHHLQAGAFQKAADAENMKAKLALIGIEAGIQEASHPDKGTVYRVRIGPLPSAAEMNRVKNLLSQNGVQATVVKNP